MSISKGTQAWFRDAVSGYSLCVAVQVDTDDKEQRLVFVGDGVRYERTVPLTDEDCGLMLQNPPHLQATDDLTTLSYLHE